MKKKISKFALARKKVLQIGFLSLFIFLAFFNFTLAQAPGDDCGPILTGSSSDAQCSDGEAFPSCQLLAPCTDWDATGVGRCYFKDLTAASYCINTGGLDWGEDVEILIGDASSPFSICIDSPSSGSCGGLLDEEWTWSGTASINEYVNMPPPPAPPGATLNSEIDAYLHNNHSGNCDNTDFKSEIWEQAQVSYTYQLCCPPGYTYDESGSPMCVAQADTDCEGDLGGTCCEGQVCPVGHQLAEIHDIVSGCTQPEKCCAIGQCADSAGDDCIVDNQGVCCDLSDTCNIPKIGTTGCGTGTQCCLSGFCYPNAPAIPIDPTQNPTWKEVKWTPLVKIPGMPTGDAPLGGYIVALYNFLLGAIGIIAMVMLVYGGFRYMTSAGNPTAMGDAKDIFYSAIIGLALALISYLIIGTINPELLFTQDPILAPVGSPGHGTNLPVSCADKSHGGYEESESTNECRCIGYVAGNPTLSADCAMNKSDRAWNGTCDELCEYICSNGGDDNPECCAKASLLVGTNPRHVTEKEIEVPMATDIFFDTLSDSYYCADGHIVRAGVSLYTSWLDFLAGSFAEEYGEIFDSSSPCGNAECGIDAPAAIACEANDEWCNSEDGRFTTHYFGAFVAGKTYMPVLRICIETNDGRCFYVDDQSVSIKITE